MKPTRKIMKKEGDDTLPMIKTIQKDPAAASVTDNFFDITQVKPKLVHPETRSVTPTKRLYTK